MDLSFKYIFTYIFIYLHIYIYIFTLASQLNFEKYLFLSSILLIPLFSVWFNEQNVLYNTIPFDFQRQIRPE